MPVFLHNMFGPCTHIHTYKTTKTCDILLQTIYFIEEIAKKEKNIQTKQNKSKQQIEERDMMQLHLK